MMYLAHGLLFHEICLNFLRLSAFNSISNKSASVNKKNPLEFHVPTLSQAVFSPHPSSPLSILMERTCRGGARPRPSAGGHKALPYIFTHPLFPLSIKWRRGIKWGRGQKDHAF